MIALAPTLTSEPKVAEKGYLGRMDFELLNHGENK